MKKVRQFLTDNWLFLLFLAPLGLICVANKIPDNDIWFLLNNGRYVLNNGIPFIDPFTIHQSLEYVMQQWMSSVLLYGIYDIFGQYGLLVFIYIYSLIIMTVFYNLCYTMIKNKYKSIIMTTIVFLLISDYIVMRPQVFTYLILLLEILFLELYIKNDNWKYLIVLPILSLFLINMHASMWFFLIIFMLPFICNSIKLKGITIDCVRLKPLLITMVIMFLTALINPYGLDAILYIFKSYGIKEINASIGEMKMPTMETFLLPVILGTLFILILFSNIRKDVKLDIRHYLFVCGLTILGVSHNKCFPLFVLILGYVFMYFFKNVKTKKSIKRSLIIKALARGCTYGIILVSIFTLCVSIYHSVISYNDKNFYLSSGVADITEYIVDNYNSEEVILFVDFNYGGFTEFMGLKSYIDPRAELFFKRFNGKEDIYIESKNVNKNIGFDYEAFLDKYKFTHLIVQTNSYFEDYMKDNSNYEVVFNKYYDESLNNIVLMKLYVLKEFNN